MSKTAKLFQILNIGTDRQVMEHKLWALSEIRKGTEEDTTRRIYAVCSYILRRRGL